MNEAFAEARDEMQTWKHNQILAYQTAMVQLALTRHHLPAPHDLIGSDDVPEPQQPTTDHPDSTGIAGSATTSLRNAHVLADAYDDAPDQGINHGRRRSKRENANGRKIGLYRLTSRPLAEEWLRRHGVETSPRQKELFDTGRTQ